jgi:hypothetical protein
MQMTVDASPETIEVKQTLHKETLERKKNINHKFYM